MRRHLELNILTIFLLLILGCTGLIVVFISQWHARFLKEFSGDNSELTGVLLEKVQLLHLQMALAAFAVLLIFAGLTVLFARRISKPIGILADEIVKIKRLELDSDVKVESSIREIALLASSLEIVRAALRSFAPYIPKDLVRKLLEMGHKIELGGERRDVTLLFADITGLSPVAEELDLETLNALLIRYFDGISKVILQNDGMIDKYLGDGLLAFWDTPDDTPDHVGKGCKAALECQAFLERFNAELKEQGLPELRTRIGINTGVVIAGNVGIAERMDYTVIGDVVNVAFALEQLNKTYQTKILAGPNVVEKVGDRFVFRPLDISDMKGKKEKSKIFELMDGNRELADAFSEAFEAFHEGRIWDAKTLFLKINVRFPDDHPTGMYLQRLENL